MQYQQHQLHRQHRQPEQGHKCLQPEQLGSSAPAQMRRLAVRAGAVLTISLLLHGCGSGSSASVAVPVGVAAASPVVGVAPLVLAAASSKAADLGRQIFSDASLSASARQSCATCHNPDNAHAPANNLAAQLGGPDLLTQGTRAAPSLRYLNLTPAFTLAADGSPSGGFNRDGSAQTLAQQAREPFLAKHEMANADPAAVIAKLQRASYAEQFRSVFGAAIFDDPDTAFERVLLALQQFQNQNSDLHRYDSKYDQFIAGRATLEAGELRGLALFNNPTKGNCAACHTSARGSDGSAPLFTDFSFDNLGVPRNPQLPANRDPAYFDLGLCGPTREDLAKRRDLCGAFKVPTLRNVATRQAFFHNGRFQTLHEGVSFYARRDTNPEQWYPRNADGSVEKFDDLPPALRANVNVSEVPYNRQPGQTPALSPADIDDLVQFLGTLTDGYRIP